MVTTAARSVEYMRKSGFIAERVEKKVAFSKFIMRDLFGFADVLAYGPEGIILIQAYHTKEEMKHAHLVPAKNEKIDAWIRAGGKFEHHLWRFTTKKGRKYWTVYRRTYT